MDNIDAAIELAARAHRGQARKGTDLPYVSHPYAVGMMLARAGLPETVVIAGLLHDTTEDTPLTLQDIRERFGDEVASIVSGCSEPDKSRPWEERKEHTLDYLRTAPWEVRVVSLADKLHNVRTMIEAVEGAGEQVWGRFKRGRREQEWYYRGLVDALCSTPADGRDLPFCEEFRQAVDRLFDKE